MEVEAKHEQCFLRLLFVNVITSVEAYLSDLFITAIASDKNLLRRFVETNPDFASEKVALSRLFTTFEEIEQTVRSHLVQLAWHNFARVKPMFQSTLHVSFPNDLGNLLKAVLVRHDIVHRNGRKTDGSAHDITKEDVKELIRNARKLILAIENDWATVRLEEQTDRRSTEC